jgi:hypothetical protein
MNGTDLQTLSEIRVREAQILRANAELDGAYYLLGYAVECALKSCIAKQIREHDFPDKRLIVDSHTHDLAKLLGLAGLRPKIVEAERHGLALALNWTIAKDWSEVARYRSGVAPRAVDDFFAAVLDSPDGVLPWLKTLW